MPRKGNVPVTATGVATGRSDSGWGSRDAQGNRFPVDAAVRGDVRPLMAVSW